MFTPSLVITLAAEPAEHARYRGHGDVALGAVGVHTPAAPTTPATPAAPRHAEVYESSDALSGCAKPGVAVRELTPYSDARSGCAKPGGVFREMTLYSDARSGCAVPGGVVREMTLCAGSHQGWTWCNTWDVEADFEMATSCLQNDTSVTDVRSGCAKPGGVADSRASRAEDNVRSVCAKPGGATADPAIPWAGQRWAWSQRRLYAGCAKPCGAVRDMSFDSDARSDFANSACVSRNGSLQRRSVGLRETRRRDGPSGSDLGPRQPVQGRALRAVPRGCASPRARAR